MCKEWMSSFQVFLKDMGPRPAGTSLDRIDNEKGYEPSNCRWATRFEQANNKRNNVIVDHEGKKLTLKQFSKIMNVGYTRLSGRMNEKGESAHEAAMAIITNRTKGITHSAHRC